MQQNTMTKKQFGGENGLFSLYLHIGVHHQRKSGSGQEGTQEEQEPGGRR